MSEARNASRAQVYCLVPEELADELLDALREHYALEPTVCVVIDRRQAERRSGIDRRLLHLGVADLDRRAVKPDRRERGDRRSPQIPRNLAALPAPFDAHADALRWAQRLPAVSRQTEDLTLRVLVQSIREGEPDASTELYWRCFERVYSRLRSLCGRFSAADDHVRGAFGALFDALPSWDPVGEIPFESFLYGVIDGYAENLPKAALVEDIELPGVLQRGVRT